MAKLKWERVNKWIEIVRDDGRTFIVIDKKILTSCKTEDEDTLFVFLGLKERR